VNDQGGVAREELDHLPAVRESMRLHILLHNRHRTVAIKLDFVTVNCYIALLKHQESVAMNRTVTFAFGHGQATCQYSEQKGVSETGLFIRRCTNRSDLLRSSLDPDTSEHLREEQAYIDSEL
jgi:hypothetical protein